MLRTLRKLEGLNIEDVDRSTRKGGAKNYQAGRGAVSDYKDWGTRVI